MILVWIAFAFGVAALTLATHNIRRAEQTLQRAREANTEAHATLELARQQRAKTLTMIEDFRRQSTGLTTPPDPSSGLSVPELFQRQKLCVGHVYEMGNDRCLNCGEPAQ